MENDSRLMGYPGIDMRLNRQRAERFRSNFPAEWGKLKFYLRQADREGRGPPFEVVSEDRKPLPLLLHMADTLSCLEAKICCLRDEIQ